MQKVIIVSIMLAASFIMEAIGIFYGINYLIDEKQWISLFIIPIVPAMLIGGVLLAATIRNALDPKKDKAMIRLSNSMIIAPLIFSAVWWFVNFNRQVV
jgi:hypothetical protein